MNQEPHKPCAILDAIRSEYGLKNDAQVSRLIGVNTPVISKIRNGHVQPSADIKLRIMRALKWSLSKMDEICPPTED